MAIFGTSIIFFTSFFINHASSKNILHLYLHPMYPQTYITITPFQIHVESKYATFYQPLFTSPSLTQSIHFHYIHSYSYWTPNRSPLLRKFPNYSIYPHVKSGAKRHTPTPKVGQMGKRPFSLKCWHLINTK